MAGRRTTSVRRYLLDVTSDGVPAQRVRTYTIFFAVDKAAHKDTAGARFGCKNGPPATTNGDIWHRSSFRLLGFRNLGRGQGAATVTTAVFCCPTEVVGRVY